MSAAENQKLIDVYWKAFEEGDVDAAMALFSDDAQYENTALQRLARGKDEVREMWSMWFAMTAPGSLRITLDNRVVGDDSYALEWTVSGTLSAEAGGTSFDVRGVSVGTIRDDLIASNTDYSNMAAAMSAPAAG